MQYDKIKKRPVRFLSITGLKLEDFNFLVPYFRTIHILLLILPQKVALIT